MRKVTRSSMMVDMVRSLPESSEIISQLVTARVDEDADAPIAIANRLARSGDAGLLLTVLCGLVTLYADAQTKPPVGPGPPLAPLEDRYTPEQIAEATRTWHTGMADQLEAAAGAGDWGNFARIAVDSQVRAAVEDIRDGVRDDSLSSMTEPMVVCTQQALVLIAAEMLRRLVQHELPQKRAE